MALETPPATQERDHTRAALAELLLALADDEFVTGYANSEWTGIAPILEEDIAFSSLAQDELGHARLFYELLAELRGGAVSPDEIAYDRPPEGFRNAQLAERPRGDWAYSVSRQFLYDTADYVRLECLLGSRYTPLAQAAASVIREERYHLLHAHTWLARLAAGDTARERQHAAFTALWPDALGLFEPLPGEAALVESGIQPAPAAALCQRWLEQIEPMLRQLGLPWPFAQRAAGWEPLLAPHYGGRAGRHSREFAQLYDTITSVRRLEPGAQW